MKSYHARSGPFAERPYYELSEIEQICTEELHGVGLYPARPEPVRVERFIEKRFNISPAYEDLPQGVLGYTRFNRDGVEAIVVSRVLCEEGSRTAERRINTTLAHEGGGHGLLHAHLFVLGADTRSLFEGDADVVASRILCRDGSAATDQQMGRRVYRGRWWEFQANQAMGALLLPRKLVDECLERILVQRGSLGHPVLPGARRGEAVALVSGVFDVNPVVARIRLGELYPEHEERQLTL
jgi:hypothetical protein